MYCQQGTQPCLLCAMIFRYSDTMRLFFIESVHYIVYDIIQFIISFRNKINAANKRKKCETTKRLNMISTETEIK